MRTFWTLWRREVDACFLSATAHLVAAAFLGVTGLSFWKLAVESGGQAVSVPVLLFGPIFLWLMLMLVVTVVTMRLFVEEKRLGMLEMLMTAPVGDAAVVGAKYAAAVTVICVVVLPTAAYVPLLSAFSTGMAPSAIGPLAGGYTILALVAAQFTAIGLVFSIVCRSYVGSATCSFVVFCMLFFVDFFRSVLRGPWVGPVLDYISPVQHALRFSQGVIDTRPLVFYGTTTWLLLFLAVRLLRSRRWA